MFNRRITAGLMGGVVAVGLVLGGSGLAAFTAQDATKLEAEAKATLAKFQADTKGAEEVFANAKGILVCPKITKGGFIIGVESGDCVLTKGAPKPIYYGTSRAQGGTPRGHRIVLDDPGAEHGRRGGQVHQGRARMGDGRGCVGGRGQGGRWRRSRHDQSEERHRVLHLRREGA